MLKRRADDGKSAKSGAPGAEAGQHSYRNHGKSGCPGDSTSLEITLAAMKDGLALFRECIPAFKTIFGVAQQAKRLLFQF